MFDGEAQIYTTKALNAMVRSWNKLENDEIAAIWRGYLQTEFRGYDVLRQSIAPGIDNFRLTPMEIIRLVDELMRRLNMQNPDEPMFRDKDQPQ
jgi:hypothetical protein